MKDEQLPPQTLSPGYRVVELGAVAQSAAVITGVVAGLWLMRLIGRSWLASGIAFAAGAALGFAVGNVVARTRYRSADGRTVVAKVGVGALGSAVPAGLAGALSTAVMIALLALVLFGAKVQAASLFAAALGCGAVIGPIVACLASLP